MGLKDLRIKIFADGADLDGMVQMYRGGLVRGFTTNPTLMRKAGITDYAAFAVQALKAIPDMSISFEVFSDDPAGMEREARIIAGWGKNVHVKVPVTDTRGVPTAPLIRKLAEAGVQLNVTAILTLDQVRTVVDALRPGCSSIVSVFAGRIADTGVDPVPVMREALAICRQKAGVELLWASCREILNIFQAEQSGCDIVTVPNDILKKAELIGMDLAALSLDTVKMFARDASSSGFKI